MVKKQKRFKGLRLIRLLFAVAIITGVVLMIATPVEANASNTSYSSNKISSLNNSYPYLSSSSHIDIRRHNRGGDTALQLIMFEYQPFYFSYLSGINPSLATFALEITNINKNGKTAIVAINLYVMLTGFYMNSPNAQHYLIMQNAVVPLWDNAVDLFGCYTLYYFVLVANTPTGSMPLRNRNGSLRIFRATGSLIPYANTGSNGNSNGGIGGGSNDSSNNNYNSPTAIWQSFLDWATSATGLATSTIMVAIFATGIILAIILTKKRSDT